MLLWYIISIPRISLMCTNNVLVLPANFELESTSPVHQSSPVIVNSLFRAFFLMVIHLNP